MGIDIRLPIGLMFGVLGVLLSVFGLLGDKSIYQRSLGINVNLGWGLVLMVFACVMLWLSWRTDRAEGKADPERPRD